MISAGTIVAHPDCHDNEVVMTMLMRGIALRYSPLLMLIILVTSSAFGAATSELCKSLFLMKHMEPTQNINTIRQMLRSGVVIDIKQIDGPTRAQLNEFRNAKLVEQDWVLPDGSKRKIMAFPIATADITRSRKFMVRLRNPDTGHEVEAFFKVPHAAEASSLFVAVSASRFIQWLTPTFVHPAEIRKIEFMGEQLEGSIEPMLDLAPYNWTAPGAYTNYVKMIQADSILRVQFYRSRVIQYLMLEQDLNPQNIAISGDRNHLYLLDYENAFKIPGDNLFSPGSSFSMRDVPEDIGYSAFQDIISRLESLSEDDYKRLAAQHIYFAQLGQNPVPGHEREVPTLPGRIVNPSQMMNFILGDMIAARDSFLRDMRRRREGKPLPDSPLKEIQASDYFIPMNSK